MRFKVTGGLNEVGNGVSHINKNTLGYGARGCQRTGTFGKENVAVLEATYKRIEAVVGYGDPRNLDKK